MSDKVVSVPYPNQIYGFDSPAGVVLNISPPGKMDNGQKKSISSKRRKCITDGQRQTGLLCIHDIGGNNVCLRKSII